MPQALGTMLHGQELVISAGQRQLLVLARLLLRSNHARVVLLDEPAAGMEESASSRLHGVLHDKLAHASLIAITHRLLPLLHLFTRVLAFDCGQCVEDGTPSHLLQQPASQLSFLFNSAPPRLQAHVRRMLALHRSRVYLHPR